MLYLNYDFNISKQEKCNVLDVTDYLPLINDMFFSHKDYKNIIFDKRWQCQLRLSINVFLEVMIS